MTEADRVFVYLGFFLAAFLIAQTDQRRQRFAEGVGFALIAIAVLALAARILPHAVELGDGLGGGARLRWPLGYWNANGLLIAIGAAFAVWLGRRSSIRPLRWIAVGALPTILLALYLTYSRGGLLALAVACGCLLVLSRDRLWLAATLAVGAIGALPALLAVQARRALADNFPSQAAIDQGVTVLLFLLLGTALALLLFAGLRRLEGRGGQRAERAVAISRNPKVLRWIAVVVAVVGIGAAIGVGSRAWDQFTSSDVQVPGQPEENLTRFSSNGRDEYWRVAVKAFGEEPILGHGAGTYQLSWAKLREIPVPVRDAHSLYLEAFAELGVLGGALVIALVAAILWIGLSAWRHASGRHRELYAILLAACLAFAVGAGIDWFWEIAAVGAVFFLCGAALVAARCAQLARARADGNGRGEQRRYGLAVAGLALAWIAALALVGPLLVDHEIDASQAAAADGNPASAVNHADTARSIEPWAASPYVQLGLLAEVDGDYPTAIGRFSQAIHREEGNWLLYYLRARAEHEAGNEAAARADQREARRLNPEEECLREGFEGCG